MHHGTELRGGQGQLLQAVHKVVDVVRGQVAEHSGDHAVGQLFTFPVGSLAQGHDGTDQGVVGTDLQGDEVRFLDIFLQLRHRGILHAGIMVHGGHGTSLNQVCQVLGHHGGQAQVDGVVTIQAQLVGYIAHKALAIVAFVIAGHIEAVLYQLVLQAAQAHAGGHAVTDGDIGVLFFGGGLCNRRHSIFFGKSFRLHFLHGGFRLSSLFGGGVLCKGRNGQRQQQRGRQQQACNAFCFHGHHSLFPRNISRLRNCFHDKEMKEKCQLTKRGKSQEKVVKIEAFEAECRK